MNMADSIVEKTKAAIKIDADLARITIAGQEVAYHCDKFATRIIKGLEDILGVEKASELLANSAATTTLELNQALVKLEPDWDKLGVPQRLEKIFEIYKLLGFGAVKAEKMDGSSTKVTSKSSYLAEGYLENMQRWMWPIREKIFCHDMCGYLQSAWALATDKPLGAFAVKETQCRTTGADQCVFIVEVK
jgi:hypothetical protein